MLREMEPGESAGYNLGEIARRAAIVFAAEGWIWHDSPQPTAIEIETAIRQFIAEMKRCESESYGSGRLAIRKDELYDGGIAVTLELGGLTGTELETL